MQKSFSIFGDLPLEIGELTLSLCDNDVLLSLAQTNRYLNGRLIPILLMRLVQIDIQSKCIQANWPPEDPRHMQLLNLLNLWVWKPSLPHLQYTFFGSSCQESVAQHETGTIVGFIGRLASVDTLSFKHLDNLFGASEVQKHDFDTWRLNLVKLLKTVLHKRCRRLTLDHGPKTILYVHEPIPYRLTGRTSFIGCPPSLEVLHLRDSMMLLPFFLPHTLEFLRSQSPTLVELVIFEDSVEGWQDFFASVSAPLLQELVIKRKSYGKSFAVSLDLLSKFFHRHPALRRLKLDHVYIPKSQFPSFDTTSLLPNLEYLDAHPTILATLLTHPMHFPKLSYISVSLTSYEGFVIHVLTSQINYSVLNRSKPIHLSFAIYPGGTSVCWFEYQTENPVSNPLQYLPGLEELTVVFETTRYLDMRYFLELLPDWLSPLSTLKALRVGCPYHVVEFRKEIRKLRDIRPSLRIRTFDSSESICGDRGLNEEEFEGEGVRPEIS